MFEHSTFDIRHLAFSIRYSAMHSNSSLKENLLMPASSYLILDEFTANQRDYRVLVESFAEVSTWNLFACNYNCDKFF